VADLTLEEKKKMMREFFDKTWIESLKVGDFIDAEDTVQKQCLASVT